MKKLVGAAILGQSGGPTSVINAVFFLYLPLLYVIITLVHKYR